MIKSMEWLVTSVTVNAYGIATVTLQPKPDEYGTERFVFYCPHEEAPRPFDKVKINIGG